MAYPNVYVFNPTCEMAVLNGSVSYMPPERLRLFEHDVSGLMAWVAGANDVVLVDEPCVFPPPSVFDLLGIEVPRAVTMKQLAANNSSLGELRPWGWSPEICHRFKPLVSRFNTPLFDWKLNHKPSFGRFTNQRLVDALLPLLENVHGVQIPSKPIEAKTLGEVNLAIASFSGRAVVKTPWSSSGRGIAMVDVANKRLIDERWLAGALKQQGALFVEPLLDKRHDLSFHFWMHPSGNIDYLGHNFFDTDGSGKFKGCFLQPYPASIQGNLSEVEQCLRQASVLLLTALSTLGLSDFYNGPLGVDALLFDAGNGQLVLHPAIEINLRYTMGYVNLQMRKKIGEDVVGQWQIAQFSKNGWAEFCSQQSKLNPLEPDGQRLVKGFLPLLPPSSTFGAWMELG